jgi:DNA-binding transcriptional regulator YiaG
MRKKQRATAEDSLMGARFRELRNRLRPDLASAHELGDALRVTAQTVRNWERGQHIPVPRQRAVRRLLGCDPADLWEPPGYPTLREKIEEMFREMKGRRANLREAVEQSWKELQEIDAKRHKAIVAKLMSMISVAAVAPDAVETVPGIDSRVRN